MLWALAAVVSVAHNALERAQREFSWEAVSREFETILQDNQISFPLSHREG